MLDRVVNVLTSPAMQHIAQNTNQSVTIETSLKAVGRPAFTLMDKNVDEDTRKYSAAKELIYQALCLGIYLAVIPAVFQKGGFNIAKKYFASEGAAFPRFKKFEDYMAYHKLACMPFNERLGKTYSSKLAKANEKLQKCKDELSKATGFDKIAKKYQEYKAGLNVKAIEKQEKKRKELFEVIDKFEDNFKESPDTKNTIAEGLYAHESPKKYPRIKGSIEVSSIIGSVVGLTILAPELSHLLLHPIMHAFGMKAPKAKADTEETPNAIDKKA